MCELSEHILSPLTNDWESTAIIVRFYVAVFADLSQTWWFPHTALVKQDVRPEGMDW